MRTERPTLPRLLSLPLIGAALPLMAQTADAAQAPATPGVPMPVIYGLVALAVVQVIFIISLSSIMRTLGGPGGWARTLGQGGRRAMLLLPLIAAGALDAHAQAYQGDGGTMPVYHLMWWLLGTNILLFVILLVQINLLRGMTRAVTGFDEKPEELKEPVGPSWEERFLASLTRRKSIEEEKDILMHHEYDGIRELDNVLPPWWLWLFYGSVIWGFVYLINVHVLDIWPKQDQEYITEMTEAKASTEAFLAAQMNQVDERNVAYLTDAGALAQGAAIFKQNCATCHGQLGEGTAGPNLTDEYWLHGGSITNVFTTIKYGVSGKAMKAWKTDLKPLEMQAVASYVLSLKGTNPPNPKAPEGEIWKGDTAVPVDSLATPADTTRLASAQ